MEDWKLSWSYPQLSVLTKSAPLPILIEHQETCHTASVILTAQETTWQHMATIQAASYKSPHPESHNKPSQVIRCRYFWSLGDDTTSAESGDVWATHSTSKDLVGVLHPKHSHPSRQYTWCKMDLIGRLSGSATLATYGNHCKQPFCPSVKPGNGISFFFPDRSGKIIGKIIIRNGDSLLDSRWHPPSLISGDYQDCQGT